MASFNIFDHTTTSVTLSSTQRSVYVAQSGSLINGINVTGTPFETSVTVDGYVSSITLSGTTGEAFVAIGANGTVGSASVGSAIFLNDTTDSTVELFVQNAGTVFSADTVIRLLSDDELVLVNSGSISGDDIAFSSGSIEVTNTGTLTAFGQQSSFANIFEASGSIYINNIGDILMNGDSTTFNKIAESDSRVDIVNDGVINSRGTGVDAFIGATLYNSGVFSTKNDGLETNTGDITINNTGSISVVSVLADIGSAATASDDIFIENTGTIAAAIVADNNGDGEVYLTNSGTIIASQVIVADDFNFNNSGTILGSAASSSDLIAVTGTGNSGGRIINTGTITTNGSILDADMSSMLIANHGTMSGGDRLLDISSTSSAISNRIVNTGTIDSSGDAISVNANNSFSLINRGDIIAEDDAVTGLNMVGVTTIVNTGLIQADNNAIALSNSTGVTSAHTVLNSGSIIGDVSLSAGDDLYFGRYGSIDGDIFLGGGDDTASGGDQGERIEGGDGIDRIFGFGGDDNLFGDAGNDVLRGGDGDDGVNGGADNDDLGGGAGNDVLLGADGNDLLRGDYGADILNGGDGFDRASYADSSTGITIDLADTGLSTGFAQGDSYVSIEAYEATAYADVMFGDDVNNLLRGMDGDDQISGRGGNDNLQGFDGDDILSGGTGNDTLNGGDGDDIAAFTGDQADYTFTLLGNGNIRVEDTVGSDGIDVLVAVEFVTFNGGAEIDVTGLI